MSLNVVLTGATGLIGQHVLYELVKENFDNADDFCIHVIVRSYPHSSAKQRIEKLFDSENRPEFLNKFNGNNLLKNIHIIDANLNQDNLKHIISENISQNGHYHIIHCAASTNLSNGNSAESDIYENNYKATKNLIEAFFGYNIKFTFVSTAFSCGIQSGELGNEFLGKQQAEFRNIYEMYKNRTENELNAYCKLHQIELQILRPAIVSGRLHEAPLYYTSKFDVFYGFAKFFWKISQIQDQIDGAIRIHINKDAGLNIVPVDYVAKVIVNVFQEDVPELNIVAKTPLRHVDFIYKVMGVLNFKKYAIVDREVSPSNRFEELYYRSVVPILGPYMKSPAFSYNVDVLNTIVELPDVDMALEMSQLVDYAVRREFVDS